MKNGAIECSMLTKKYSSLAALNEVTFSIEKDKIVGLIGRNGAGKTTLMKLCAGQLRQNYGQIKVFDQEPFDNLKVLPRVIYISEEIQYENALSLRDILRIYSMHYSNWDPELETKLMKDFDLKEKQKYNGLSKGMKAAFNIIVALCSKAEITLMDEPTAGIDSATRKDFYHVLLESYMEYPRTFVISSHLVDEIENLLEEILLIDNGSVVLQAPTEEMQQYGICINGNKDVVLPLIQDKQVFSIDYLGNKVIAAIKNDLTQSDLDYISKNDISIANVRVNDVCNYLTKRKGGGISE